MGAIDFLQTVTLLCAAMLGVMIFFGGVVAPTVFNALPAEAAGTFLRRIFPRYYDVLTVTAVIAALLAIGSWSGLVLALVVGLFVIARFWLMPKINAARDASLKGDAVAKRRFGTLHGASVAINLSQMVALAVIIVLAE